MISVCYDVCEMSLPESVGVRHLVLRLFEDVDIEEVLVLNEHEKLNPGSVFTPLEQSLILGSMDAFHN